MHPSRSLMLAAVLLTVGFPASAYAQRPGIDLFAGYSYLPANGDDFPRQGSHGLQLAAGIPVTPWFSIAADFGSQWERRTLTDPNFAGLVAETNVREYLVGPRFTARGERANLFVHGWFGAASGDAGDTFRGFSDSAIAFGGGGGLDLHVSPSWSVRAQYDLIGSFADIVEGNARMAAGVVWNRR